MLSSHFGEGAAFLKKFRMLALGFVLVFVDVILEGRLLFFDIVLLLPINGVVELAIVRGLLAEVYNTVPGLEGSGGVGGRPVDGLRGKSLPRGDETSRGLRNMRTE